MSRTGFQRTELNKENLEVQRTELNEENMSLQDGAELGEQKFTGRS